MNEVIKKYREEITQKLIEALKNGTAPWIKPWNGSSAPVNAVTGEKYNGTNNIALSLIGEQYDNGEDPRWCTFKQAAAKKWHIKRGAKGTKISYWRIMETKPDDQNDEESLKSTWLMQRVYVVFHASQIENMPEYIHETLSPEQCCEKAERIIADTGANIRHGGFEAFYNRSEDYIQVPKKENFKTLGGYYATVLHELTHWSGAPSRLDREKGKKFGDERYAREELVAEIASMFLSNETGIAMTDEHFKNHAAYISSWISLLKNDSDAVFKAASDASKAAEFILRTEREREKTQSQKNAA